MSFARHETFYIRDGWLRKGLKLISDQPEGYNFLKSNEAPEVLGMGKNMVQSLRFWLQATGLVKEKPDNNENGERWLTDFGALILMNDQYLEEEDTLWLIHYHLVSNPNQATTWYWFFNFFNHREFDETSFKYWLQNYVTTEGQSIADGSLKKDFQCFINTYLFEKSFNRRTSPEDNLNCPLRELKYIKKIGPHQFRLDRVNRRSLTPDVFLYVIKKWHEEQMKETADSIKPEHGITITDIIEGINNAGKVFALTYDDVMYYLEKLQNMKKVFVNRTAGLDSVNFSEDILGISSKDILTDIYENRGDTK